MAVGGGLTVVMGQYQFQLHQIWDLVTDDCRIAALPVLPPTSDHDDGDGISEHRFAPQQ